MYWSRLIIGIFIGAVLALIAVLSFVDFSVVEINLAEDQLAEADYFKVQADFRDEVARRQLGNPDAPIKFTLYTGFDCEGCKDFYQQVFGWLRFNMIDTGKVYFDLKFYPLLNKNPEALIAAEASMCAAEQGDFYAYHDLLFERQEDWKQNVVVNDYLIELAKNQRYRESSFRKCLLTGKYEQFVKLELADAINKGVTGAPTVILEAGDLRKVIEGGISPKIYEQEINALLEAKTEVDANAEKLKNENADDVNASSVDS